MFRKGILSDESIKKRCMERLRVNWSEANQDSNPLNTPIYHKKPRNPRVNQLKRGTDTQMINQYLWTGGALRHGLIVGELVRRQETVDLPPPNPEATIRTFAEQGSQAVPEMADQGAQAIPAMAEQGAQAVPEMAEGGTQAEQVQQEGTMEGLLEQLMNVLTPTEPTAMVEQGTQAEEAQAEEAEPEEPIAVGVPQARTLGAMLKQYFDSKGLPSTFPVAKLRDEVNTIRKTNNLPELTSNQIKGRGNTLLQNDPSITPENLYNTLKERLTNP